MHQGKAKLAYYGDYCVAYADKELVKYYLSLVPKYYCAAPQMWDAHITVSRRSLDTVTNGEAWGKYESQYINYDYDGIIKYDDKKIYFWLDVWSDDIMRIRTELGATPLVPGFSCYHMTIGNRKHECLK